MRLRCRGSELVTSTVKCGARSSALNLELHRNRAAKRAKPLSAVQDHYCGADKNSELDMHGSNAAAPLLANTFTGIGHKPQDEKRVSHLLKCAESVSVYKQYREYGNLLQGKPAARFLDIGCGIGETCRNLSHLVGTAGRVVGLDTSQGRLKTAKRLTQQQSRRDDAAEIEWVRGKADTLPFPDESFDSIRIERTLQHVSDVPKVLSEAARTLCQGGTLITVDPDWNNFSISSPYTDIATTHQILSFWTKSFACGDVAERMNGWLTDVGLVTTEIKTFLLDYDNSYHLAEILFDLERLAPAVAESGTISKNQASDWLLSLKKADRERCLKWSMPLDLIHARK